MKSEKRLRLLERWTPPTPGKYVCTVPGCGVKEKQDGFCPTHHDIPLRLKKYKH